MLYGLMKRSKREIIYELVIFSGKRSCALAVSKNRVSAVFAISTATALAAPPKIAIKPSLLSAQRSDGPGVAAPPENSTDGGMDIIHGKKLSRDEQRVVVITQLINICVGIIGMMNIFISQFFFEDLESADIIHHPIRYSLISRVPKQIKNLRNVVGISDLECLNQLRMTRDVFSRLCFVLQNSSGLKASRNTSVGEQVAMFLSILAHHTKNRIVKSKYMRSGRTVSKYFHRVLNAIIKLHKLLLARPNPIDDDCNDNRWKFFKNCLGALDGSYVSVTVPRTDQPRYRNRKGQVSVNVLAVCDRIMDTTGSSCRGENEPAMTETIRRRIWTLKEEYMLARAMEKIILDGWKTENGFKNGYLKQLEKEIKKIDPQTDLRSEPHISSRVHAWKRYQQTISAIIDKSGMSWDSTKFQIVVENEDVWADYIKVEPFAKTVRYKSFPLYGRWCDIFGADRARGETCEDCDIADGAPLPDHVAENIPSSIPTPTTGTHESPGTQSDAGSPKSKEKGKKRKSVDSTGVQMVNLMGKFFETTTKSIGEMTSTLSNDQKMSQKREKLIEELGKLGGLSPDQRIVAAKMLANNNNDLELFFSAGPEDKSRLVYLMLSDRL
ncbi:hypothetical protein ACS0TY_007197 [Phlomoides rotata]